MSQAAASPMPPPSAAPCTRASVGVRARSRSCGTARRACARRRGCASSGAAPWRFIQFRSAPAEKLLPSPASTMARTLGVGVERGEGRGQLGDQRLVEGVVHLGAVHPDPGGRPAALDLQGLGSPSPASHAEDAELRRRDRRVERRRQRQAEHAARLRRIDDAVVPQPRGGVVRMALRLVLRADRRLERLLFLRRSTGRPWPRCRRA